MKNNPQKALAILEEGRKILYRSPHLYAKIIDEKYINYIESLITSEIEQKYKIRTKIELVKLGSILFC